MRHVDPSAGIVAREPTLPAAPGDTPTCFHHASNFDQDGKGHQLFVREADPDSSHSGLGASIHFLPLRRRSQSPATAFERELLALLPRLRRFARALARNASDADDLLQVALERALKARDQWQPGTRLDAWTMRIVRNCWIDEGRKRSRRALTFAPPDEIDRLGSDSQRDIERYVEVQQVDRAMNTLPREQREAIALVLVEGLAYREAAERLRIPMGTLTSRVTRGRHALVQMLVA